MIQYIKLNNTKQIQINDSGKGVYHALVWFWKGRRTKITYGELSDKSGVSDHGIRFWIQALANIGVIEIENEGSYISFTLKHIERDNVEFFYSGF